MKTTYEKDGRLPQHTAVGNDDTPITYPTSPHEWMSVKAVEEKDGRIVELTAENERLQTALDATWDALDGLYGADIGEESPIDLLPKDRQQLFHKALEMVGAALDGREAE